MRKVAKLLLHPEHTIFKAAHREESDKLSLGDYKLVFVMTIKTHVIIFLCDG